MENELDFDLSSINIEENKSAIKYQLNCQGKHMPERNKIVLEDNNTFPEILDIQTCFAEN